MLIKYAEVLNQHSAVIHHGFSRVLTNYLGTRWQLQTQKSSKVAEVNGAEAMTRENSSFMTLLLTKSFQQTCAAISGEAGKRGKLHDSAALIFLAAVAYRKNANNNTIEQVLGHSKPRIKNRLIRQRMIRQWQTGNRTR